MTAALYHILVIALAVVAVVKGYRRGFTGQVSGILGLAFGVVCAHVAAPAVMPYAEALLGGRVDSPGGDYAVRMLSAGGIYIAVCSLMGLLTGVLRSAMQLLDTGMLDSLIGTLFSLLRYMMVVSIAYNMMADVNPRGKLLKYATDHDGNVVETVMRLAPAALGCPGADDLAHEIQLLDARKIS